MNTVCNKLAGELPGTFWESQYYNTCMHTLLYTKKEQQCHMVQGLLQEEDRICTIIMYDTLCYSVFLYCFTQYKTYTPTIILLQQAFLNSDHLTPLVSVAILVCILWAGLSCTVSSSPELHPCLCLILQVTTYIPRCHVCPCF